MKIKYTSTILNLISLKHLITLAIWLLSSVFCLPSHAAGTWTATSSMSIARSGHTATLLTNGKVLVAGGGDGSNYLNSAELYDPNSGTWSNAGVMNSVHAIHTATLLSNGKVLVTGGNVTEAPSWTMSAKADVYDPATNTWTQTGSMAVSREHHGAIKLPNGQVLITGGITDGYPVIASAELYNPTTGTWTAAGSMSVKRAVHSVALLPNGTALIIGGQNCDPCWAILNTTEIFDSLNNTWASGAPMNLGRSDASASLLSNGKVLIAGGQINNDTAVTDSTEIYNPATATWSVTGAMAAARAAPTSTLLSNGKVLVTGGFYRSGSDYLYLDSAETYDPATGAWTATAAMSRARAGHTATRLINGQVLVVGGSGDSGTTLASAELYTDVMTPVAVTDAPSLITSNSAILKGTVNPNGADTLVNFDFGTTTTYGTNIAATPTVIAANAAATSVSAGKTGLTCGTVYHYRVTADNSFGTGLGADRSFTTSVCPRDLIVTNITLNPAKPVAGTAFSTVVTVKNQGTVGTTPSKLKLWTNLVTVPVCTTVAPKIADVAALAAGASVNVTVTGLISNLVGGNTFRAFADGTCVIGETNETNNQKTLSYRIDGRKPDLVITNITLTPVTPAKNTIFNSAITVKNQGTDVSGSSFLDVWTNQATAATCGTVGNGWSDIGALAVGASTVVNVTGLNAGATAGVKTLRAFVDSWCEETESNEVNNQMTKTYSVQ